MMTSSTEEILERIDAVIAESNPAEEPMLLALSEGNVSRDELRAFATQYFYLVDSLPRFVSRVHSVSLDASVRRSLLNIVVALELNPPSIGDLWLQTCAALGLFSDTVRSSIPSTSTEACLSDYEYLCSEGSIQGIAALYAWITRLPQVCRIKKQALAEHYDLNHGPGIQYFDVVSFQSAAHSRALHAALAHMLDKNPEAADTAIYSARAAVSAVNGLYAGAFTLAI